MKKIIIILIAAGFIWGGCGSRQPKTASESDSMVMTLPEDINPDNEVFLKPEKPTPTGIFDIREEPVPVIFNSETYNNMEHPFEGSWLMITMTDIGYVVYDYPDWDDDEEHTPDIINVTDNILTHRSWNNEFLEDTVFDEFWVYPKDGSFYFPCDNFLYSFKWIDKEKYIAQWTQYNKDKRILHQEYYINRTYNKFPIIMYDWD